MRVQSKHPPQQFPPAQYTDPPLIVDVLHQDSRKGTFLASALTRLHANKTKALQNEEVSRAPQNVISFC